MDFINNHARNNLSELLRSTNAAALSITAAKELKRYRKDILIGQLELEEAMAVIQLRLQRHTKSRKSRKKKQIPVK